MVNFISKRKKSLVKEKECKHPSTTSRRITRVDTVDLEIYRGGQK